MRAVRTLERSEVPAAAALLARAFDADPIFQFLFATQREAWLRWTMAVTLRQGLSHGVVFAIDDASGALAGTVTCVPPGRWPIGLWGFLRAGIALPPSLPPWRFLDEGAKLDRAVMARHPPVPHWYIYVLGVDPAFTGQGFGGALLRHVASLADEAAVPAHLETTNPSNLALYRKFGFEVTEELRIAAAPPAWIMTRSEKTNVESRR